MFDFFAFTLKINAPISNPVCMFIKIRCERATYDSGRSRTLLPNVFFYKHSTSPRSAKPLFINSSYSKFFTHPDSPSILSPLNLIVIKGGHTRPAFSTGIKVAISQQH